jgi:hydroxymethylbilane synthase
VHSAKDLPGELPAGLALLGAPARAPTDDVLCGARALSELAPGDRVGTSSIRRIAQLRAAREDVEVVALRGNVDTRLQKLADPRRGLRAIVLARAGLARLDREDAVGCVLDPSRFVPAPGQGALALEGRSDDDRASSAARAITDASTFACLRAERALARALGADCHTPLGAAATPSEDGESLLLRGWAGLPDGSGWVTDELCGSVAEPEALGGEVAARMGAAGAQELLRRAQETAGVAGS